jgi:tetratricopeptide (TPR) repeat protein
MAQLHLDRILTLQRIGFLALAFGLYFSTEATAAVVAEANQVGDTFHIEFKGSPHWDYNIQKNGKKIEIEVPKLAEATVEALKKLNQGDVQVTAIRHDGTGGSDLITLQSKNPDLEVFDYLTDQPSRLIIDLFAKKSDNKTSTKSSVSIKPLPPKAKSENSKAATLTPTKSRQPATADKLMIAEKEGEIQATQEPPVKEQVSKEQVAGGEVMNGIFDGGDPKFERFQIKDYEIKEESLLSAENRYYLDFPMLKESNGDLDKIRANQPVYQISSTDTEENKQARLLLTLFENKRYNVFIKTVGWFYEKFPKSQYDEIIKFMWADTHYALWNQDHDLKDFDLAMLRYRQAIESYPKSPLLERTMMLMSFASMDRGDYLGTLRLLQKHLNNRPNSPNRDIARLAMAENYSALSQFDDAARTYEEIQAQASSPKYQVTAAFLRGDAEYKRKNFAKAVELYRAAIQKNPAAAKGFPNAYYNQAAALFRQGQARESLNIYLDFLKLFPTHSYAPYAMTRVGEILDRLGADKSKVMGAYLETYFRYGDSPGAAVARMRMLSSRMSSMKDKELLKATEDINKMAAISGLAMADQFATVLIAEGLASRKEFEKSIALLTKFYQMNPTTADKALLNRRIVNDITAEIKDLGDSGKYLEALRIHEKYSDNWLKDTDRIDTKYNLAKDFDQVGAPAEAYKIYRQTLNSIIALKGTPQERRISIEQQLPSTDSVILALAQSSAALGKESESYDFLRQIKNPEALSETEQIKRVDLASKLLEKKGDLLSSQRYLVELIKTWKGQPKMVAQPYLHLGELEEKQNQPDEALKSYQKVDELNEDSKGQVPSFVHEKALERIAEIYLHQKKTDKAAQAYDTLLKQYESKVPLASFRYKMGKIFFDKGDLGKANEAWLPLKGSKNSIWYGLADEQLKNANWNGDYKKYIQRIPAMSKADSSNEGR